MTWLNTWQAVRAAPGGRAAQPSFPPFGDSGLTDDRGRRYRLSFETGAGGWHDSGVLRLSPVPPAGLRWLELPISPGRVIRINVAAPDPPAPAQHERLAPAGPGERLLEAVAETLLGGGPLASASARQLASSAAEVAGALQAVHALPAGSQAPARLAALCQRRAVEVAGPLAAQARDTPLPAPWASVLASERRQDGPRGIAPAAAVLPEIDGARFVLAGLLSWERYTALTVFSWGWAPEPRGFRPGQPLSWWARDDAGRWQVGRATTASSASGTFHLQLTPPLDHAATALDVMVSGSSSRVTATLPLCWQGGDMAGYS